MRANVPVVIERPFFRVQVIRLARVQVIPTFYRNGKRVFPQVNGSLLWGVYDESGQLIRTLRSNESSGGTLTEWRAQRITLRQHSNIDGWRPYEQQVVIHVTPGVAEQIAWRIDRISDSRSGLWWKMALAVGVGVVLGAAVASY
jgi:hypothetical protein